MRLRRAKWEFNFFAVVLLSGVVCGGLSFGGLVFFDWPRGFPGLFLLRA